MSIMLFPLSPLKNWIWGGGGTLGYKYTSWSKINLKIPINQSFLKKDIQKICFYTLTNTSFIYLKNFAWTTPNKY